MIEEPTQTHTKPCVWLNQTGIPSGPKAMRLADSEPLERKPCVWLIQNRCLSPNKEKTLPSCCLILKGPPRRNNKCVVGAQRTLPKSRTSHIDSLSDIAIPKRTKKGLWLIQRATTGSGVWKVCCLVLAGSGVWRNPLREETKSTAAVSIHL